MFAHNKRLQYTVRVSEPNPGLANLMLEQFGGPQGELAAAMRYFTQAVSEDDPGRKDMLFDIATEELSHLEIIGHIVAMLNKAAKGELAEATDSAAEMYKQADRRRQRQPRDAGPVWGRLAAGQFGRRAMDRRLHRHHRRADCRPALEHRGRIACQNRLRAPDLAVPTTPASRRLWAS
jgi:hypothetical protein